MPPAAGQLAIARLGVRDATEPLRSHGSITTTIVPVRSA
jgi:hypothetical protein